MKQIWDIGRKKECEANGMTLVELIVALALTGMFAACAVMMLSSGLRLYTRIQAISDAAIVGQLLLDRIAGEISAADIPVTGEGSEAIPEFLDAGQWSDRYFDERYYLGYYIENLSFSRDEPDAHPGVVRIDLTLKNSKTGFQYTAFQYTKNYNCASEGVVGGSGDVRVTFCLPGY